MPQLWGMVLDHVVQLDQAKRRSSSLASIRLFGLIRPMHSHK